MISMGIFAAAEAGEEAAEGIAALGLDPVALLAQAVTFLVLFLVVKKYAVSGIVKNLEKRHEDISRGLHLTAEMDKAKAELDHTVERVLASARSEADDIIAEARTESGKIIQAAEEAANRRAEEIMRAAEGKISQDITEARKGLRNEVADLVVEISENILHERLDQTGDRKLIEKYLKEAVK